MVGSVALATPENETAATAITASAAMKNHSCLPFVIPTPFSRTRETRLSPHGAMAPRPTPPYAAHRRLPLVAVRLTRYFRPAILRICDQNYNCRRLVIASDSPR